MIISSCQDEAESVYASVKAKGHLKFITGAVAIAMRDLVQVKVGRPLAKRSPSASPVGGRDVSESSVAPSSAKKTPTKRQKR